MGKVSRRHQRLTTAARAVTEVAQVHRFCFFVFLFAVIFLVAKLFASDWRGETFQNHWRESAFLSESFEAG